MHFAQKVAAALAVYILAYLVPSVLEQRGGDEDELCDLHVVSPGNLPILIGRANAETQLRASAARRKRCARRCSDAKKVDWLRSGKFGVARKTFTRAAPNHTTEKSTRQ